MQSCFGKDNEATQWRQNNLTNSAGRIEQPYAKNEPQPLSNTIYRWVIDLDIRTKAMKLFEENITENSSVFRLGQIE